MVSIVVKSLTTVVPDKTKPVTIFLSLSSKLEIRRSNAPGILNAVATSLTPLITPAISVRFTAFKNGLSGAIPFKKLDKSVSESTSLIFLMTFFTPFTETEKSLNPPATIFSKLLPVVDLAIPSTTRPMPVLYNPFPLNTLLRKLPPASRRMPRLIFKLSEAVLIALPESNNLPVVA